MGKRKKNFDYSRMRCPYCGKPVVYRSAEGIYKEKGEDTMLYVCAGYPKCDSYVRVHKGTKLPVGTMADRKLRALRRKAHFHFDQLHKSGLMSRQDAYQWLSALLDAPLSEAHIGKLGEYYCNLVISASDRMLTGCRRRGEAS